MDIVKGQNLIKADGSSVAADTALSGKKLILFYFSAHWCPPCRNFTPKLKDFYGEVQKDGVEIIFVSSDRSPKDMMDYMKESHGDWLAVPHESEMDKKLNEKFEVEGIPTLVVLKADGTLVSEDGAQDVASKGAAAVQDWLAFDPSKSILDIVKEQTLEKADGSSVAAETALNDKKLILFYFSGHWCPPCKKFTPILKDFYEEVEKDGVEIVFVSCDKSPEEMKEYMKESHGDWLAVTHGSDLVQKLAGKFKVSGIPALIVLKADGTVVTKDGGQDVTGKGPAAVKEWLAFDPNQTAMDIIKGQNLIKADGSSVAADAALSDKKIVMIYFSAHWCPPCKQFTPVLKDFYEEVQKDGVEIIFVSSDRSHQDMIDYMKESHGDWLAVPHGSDMVTPLKRKFEVSGIPCLVVLKADGTFITKDGRSAVTGKGPSAVKEWL